MTDNRTRAFARWTRTPRVSQSDAERAFAIERFHRERSGFDRVSRVILAGFVAYILCIYFGIL